MNVFLDTSAIIAYHRKVDANNPRAKEIVTQLKLGGVEFFISNHTLEEVVTFLAAKDGPEQAVNVGRFLREAPEIRRLYTQEHDLIQALDRVRRYRGLSLCDALTTLFMKKYDIKLMCSFDSDFDQFEDIQRLH